MYGDRQPMMLTKLGSGPSRRRPPGAWSGALEGARVTGPDRTCCGRGACGYPPVRTIPRWPEATILRRRGGVSPATGGPAALVLADGRPVALRPRRFPGVALISCGDESGGEYAIAPHVL